MKEVRKEVGKLLYNAEQLQSVASDMLKEAARLGAQQAEVNIGANIGFSVTAQSGDVETVEYHQDKSADITVYFGKRSGSASLSDLTPQAIHAAVAAACHIAKFTDEDPAAGLADKDELAFHYPQLESAFPWALTVEEAIKLTCECERDAMSLDKRIMRAEDVRVATGEGLSVYANSQGFMGAFPFTRHEMSCVLIAKEKDEMQQDYGYTVATDPTQLESAAVIARQAVERAVRRLGARHLPTMKAPVIFAAEEARGFLGHFVAAISGGSIYRKTSFLVDQLGKKIFPDFISMQEHPHLARALGSSPFDNDGVATRENIFIENGYLQQYAMGVYSARKLNSKTTGNAGGVHNLTIHHGNKNLADLIKQMDKGLLVTDMMGNGVNIMTGDYSRGVAGFWIEKGEIQYPVHEITIASTLQDMYARIVDVGNDIDIRGNIRTGSILIEEMMIAGSA